MSRVEIFGLFFQHVSLKYNYYYSKNNDYYNIPYLRHTFTANENLVRKAPICFL